MEEVKDLRLEGAKGPDAKLAKLASLIPGFGGYHDREQRRDADQKHRDFVAKRLTSKKADLQEIGEDMLSSGGMQYIVKLDDLTNMIDRLVERTRSGITGAASVLFDKDSDAQLLDRIYEHDLALLAEVEELDTLIESLSDAVDEEDNINKAIKRVRKALGAIDATLDKRIKILKGLE